MEAGTYYVKVAVNGVPTPNAGLCNNNPKSWSCSLYVSVALLTDLLFMLMY